MTFYIEIACNQLLGNYNGDPWGGIVAMDRKFKLITCELRLVNQKMRKLFYDVSAIRDAAKFLKENKYSSLAHEYLGFVYDLANTYLMPLDNESLAQANNLCDAFFQKYKNTHAQHKIFACGHCHIDTAWLWPYEETKRKIARSWASQLEHINHVFKNSGFKFSASSAAHYWWLKKYYPELFSRVKESISSGNFEYVGGTWVEFDGNLPSGESMTRQFLYGQHFFREEFGKASNVFFLPDTFGYSC